MFLIIHENDSKEVNYATVMGGDIKIAAKILLEDYSNDNDVSKLIALKNITSIKKHFSKIKQSKNQKTFDINIENPEFIEDVPKLDIFLYRDNRWYLKRPTFTNLKYLIEINRL